MTPHDKPKRILALDVRPRSVGYVVFEGRDRLLDWGVHSFRNGVNAVRIPLGTKIATLLEDFRPVVVVAQKPPSREKVNRERTQKMLELIRRKARLRGIQTHVLKRRAARNLFAGEERMTKHKIATALAHRFAELAPLLPPKRKCTDSEDYRMSIFDALACGAAYFGPLAPAATSPAPQPLTLSRTATGFESLGWRRRFLFRQRGRSSP